MTTIYACSECGYIEGEKPPSCCRNCGTTDDPTSLDVVGKRAALREVADFIGMNAPHLADMLNAYADGDERVGMYIDRHDAWIRDAWIREEGCVHVEALCEPCGVWHRTALSLVGNGKPVTDIRPVCWNCGHRPLATVAATCRCCEGRLNHPDEATDGLCRWCADPSYREVQSD